MRRGLFQVSLTFLKPWPIGPPQREVIQADVLEPLIFFSDGQVVTGPVKYLSVLPLVQEQIAELEAP